MCGSQDKNARDLLMHLHAWHEMFLKWYDDCTAGKDAGFLPEGFNWKTTPELNQVLWQSYQSVSLAEAEKLVRASHAKIMKIVDQHTDQELFTKSYYPWTGSTSLGAYIVSATSSHYDWAAKLLKKM
jgi:hypothetical protein